MSMMAQKNRNKKCQKTVQKFFFEKNFFRPQNFEKPLFLAIFEQKINWISARDKTVKGIYEYDGSKEPQ